MSQVNFFMLPEDEATFVDAIGQRGDTQVLGDDGAVRPIAEALVDSRRLTLIREALSDLTVAPQLFRSAFIEFSRSHLVNDLLVSGRIYAKIGWLPDPEANREFKSWYSALERWIKARYFEHDGWWIGPFAAKWSQAGGKLAFGSPNARTYSLRNGG